MKPNIEIVLKRVSSIINIVTYIFVLFDALIFHGCLYRLYEGNDRSQYIKNIFLVLSIITIVTICISLCLNIVLMIKNKELINKVNCIYKICFFVFSIIALLIVEVL